MILSFIKNFFLSLYVNESFSIQKKAKSAFFAQIGLFLIFGSIFTYIMIFPSILDYYVAAANLVFLIGIIFSLIFLKYGKYYASVILANTFLTICVSFVFFRCLYIDVFLSYSAIMYIMAVQLAVISFFGNMIMLMIAASIYVTDAVIYFIIARNHVLSSQNELLGISFVAAAMGMFSIVMISIIMKGITEEALKNAEKETQKNIEQYKKISELNKKITYAHEEVLQTSIRLAAEKERLDITLRSIGEGVISTDTMGRIIIFSKMAEHITGIKAEKVMGKKIYDLSFYKTMGEGLFLLEKVISSGDPFEKELVYHNDKGELFNIVVKGAPVKDYDFGIIGAVLILSDITERSRMLEELHKTSKIESLGVFAGGIAHDFNNLLTAVLGNISIALYRTKDQRQISTLNDAEKACLRAQELTQQLLTFSQGGAPVRKITSVGKLLLETSQFVLSGSRVDCRYVIPDGLWHADIDTGQISQVIHNLVLNSIQAMDENGEIVISAENCTSLGPTSQNAVHKKGKFIKITFSDNGSGIDEKDIVKIFDPYFTTKENGSGLGLAIVYSIIKKHDGFVEVTSEKGKGSVFTLYLPASEVEIEDSKEKDMRDVSYEGKILIMDDEKLVIKVLETMLKQLGFEVSSVTSGEDAIELYQMNFNSGISFDAVIMDITIPGKMGGLETIGHLRKINPSIKAIVSSGYSNNPVMAEYTKYGFNGVLTKPYNIEELRKVVTSVLFN